MQQHPVRFELPKAAGPSNPLAPASGRKRKLLLIYPPLTVPTSPPLGGRWMHECASGMIRQGATALLTSVQPCLRAFHSYAVMMAYYRDHAMLLYVQRGMPARAAAGAGETGFRIGPRWKIRTSSPRRAILRDDQ